MCDLRDLRRQICVPRSALSVESALVNIFHSVINSLRHSFDFT